MQEFSSPRMIESAVKDVVNELFEGRLQQDEKHLMLIDEKIRALVEKDRDLLGQIEEMEAPENLRKWISDKTRDIDRKFYYDIQGLKKDSAKSSDAIAAMKERQKTFESGMNDFSRKMSDQVSTINKVIDLKDTFAKRAENLAASIKSLDARIAAERERTIVLEQDMRGAETRFDKVSDGLESLQKLSSEVRSLKEKLALADASMKKLADKESATALARRMDAEIAAVKDRQAGLEAQNAALKARLDSILSQNVTERKKVEERIKKERTKVNELLRELKS
jgi:chromosome segregation ATPase